MYTVHAQPKTGSTRPLGLAIHTLKALFGRHTYIQSLHPEREIIENNFQNCRREKLLSSMWLNHFVPNCHFLCTEVHGE